MGLRPTSYNGTSKGGKSQMAQHSGEKLRTIENGQISNLPSMKIRPSTFGGGVKSYSNVQDMISRNRTSNIVMGQKNGGIKTSN